MQSSPEPTPTVTFGFDPSAKTLFCKFPGAQNGHTATKTMEATQAALVQYPAATQMVFDLKETTFISSMFLRLCLLMVRRFGTEDFIIVNAHGEVRSIFEISNLDMLLAT